MSFMIATIYVALSRSQRAGVFCLCEALYLVLIAGNFVLDRAPDVVLELREGARVAGLESPTERRVNNTLVGGSLNQHGTATSIQPTF